MRFKKLFCKIRLRQKRVFYHIKTSTRSVTNVLKFSSIAQCFWILHNFNHLSADFSFPRCGMHLKMFFLEISDGRKAFETTSERGCSTALMSQHSVKSGYFLNLRDFFIFWKRIFVAPSWRRALQKIISQNPIEAEACWLPHQKEYFSSHLSCEIQFNRAISLNFMKF